MKYKKNIIFMILVGICICGCLWLYGEKTPEITETLDVTKEQAGQLEQTEQDMEQIYVHIVGAVKKPGVYIFQHKPQPRQNLSYKIKYSHDTICRTRAI